MEPEKTRKSDKGKFRRNIIKGIAVLFPVYLTFIMIRFLIGAFSKPLTPIFRWLAEEKYLTFIEDQWIINGLIVGVSLVVTVILLSIVGAIAQRMIGRRIVDFFEGILGKLPLIRTIYKAFRELTRILTGEAADAYKKVVYVELPGQTGKVLGFITGSITLKDHGYFHTVFVPTAPNITTGFLLLLNSDQFVETHLTPEEGLRIVISAGVLNSQSD